VKIIRLLAMALVPVGILCASPAAADDYDFATTWKSVLNPGLDLRCATLFAVPANTKITDYTLIWRQSPKSVGATLALIGCDLPPNPATDPGSNFQLCRNAP
jgi:hypothetical protein